MRDDAPLVLLLRSRDEGGDEDRYERALRERGFRATCRPVLRFAFAGDDDFGGDDAAVALRHPDRWAGLVLTSPRAAQALEEMLRWLPDRVAAWEAKPAFAVGPKTAAELRAGGLAPTGEESGDAAALGSVIAKNVRSNEEAAAERPLLLVQTRRFQNGPSSSARRAWKRCSSPGRRAGGPCARRRWGRRRRRRCAKRAGRRRRWRKTPRPTRSPRCLRRTIDEGRLANRLPSVTHHKSRITCYRTSVSD
ncbi:MAG: hypothetical protein BRD29_00695 [Bacteroidetes bacterium QH_2_67_10]|nr:MAG: hypothetical protein BRD29_00695 [Bacteroidetes bacterium QH_2_67_10]